MFTCPTTQPFKNSSGCLNKALVERAGLARKSKGKMQVTLLGKEFEIAVEEYDSFGESAFNLTIREPKKKASR